MYVFKKGDLSSEPNAIR